MRIPSSKRQAYAQSILRLLAGGGVLCLAAGSLRVDALRLIKAFAHLTQRELHRLRRALENLERQRLISLTERGEQIIIRLSPLGVKKTEKVMLADLVIPKPNTWDGRWHMVMFDVPEYLHVGRDVLRGILNRLGFYQAQKSVYLFPYPCEREILAAARALEFERYLRFFTVSILNASYERHLIKHFRVQ